jgi:hypothetical protein
MQRHSKLGLKLLPLADSVRTEFECELNKRSTGALTRELDEFIAGFGRAAAAVEASPSRIALVSVAKATAEDHLASQRRLFQLRVRQTEADRRDP